MTNTVEELPFNPKRRLCPDGACVGVIGSDGRCTVCGRTGEAAAAGADLPDERDERDERDEDDEAAALAAGSDGAQGAFDPNRRLCPDGTCVGIIGPDGRCGVCGRAAES